jgi:signal transduction histidine kinase
MMLRPRLLVRSLLIAAPAALLVTAAVDLLRARDLRIVLERVVRSQINDQVRERCESDPTWFLTGPLEGRPPRGEFVSSDPNALPPRPRVGPQPFELFAYDEAFLGSGPATPQFPREFRAPLRTSEDPVVTTYDAPGPGRGALVAMRTGWIGGRCQYFLGRMHPPPGVWTSRVTMFVSLLALTFGAAFLAVSGTMRRVQRLSSDQREALAQGFAPVAPDTRKDELSALAFMFNDAMTELQQRKTTIDDQDAALKRFVQVTEEDVARTLAGLEDRLATMASGGPGDVRELLSETHDLVARVENLIVVSKLRAAGGSPDRDRVDLSALVTRIVDRHAAVARAAGVSVKTLLPESPIHVEANEPLIERAISNVVDNAIRYNTAGGAVTIGLSREDSGRRFRLWIADTGRGVSEETFKGLTAIRRFRGDEGRIRRPGAPGLGLAVAREVADRFGLKLDLRRPGAGGFEVEFSGVEITT